MGRAPLHPLQPVASLSTFTLKVCPWTQRDQKKMLQLLFDFALSGALSGLYSSIVHMNSELIIKRNYGYIWSSQREIRQGEEIAWYADGETIVRNEHNPSIAYAYGKLLGFQFKLCFTLMFSVSCFFHRGYLLNHVAVN